MDDLAPVFTQVPIANVPTANYRNETALRLVEGVPCLVMEDDDCSYGGSQIEEALQEVGIPFLRFNFAGSSYGPSRAAFTGSGDLHWIDCDSDGHPLVRVDVIEGKVRIDPDHLIMVEDLLAAERSVLQHR